MVLNPEILMELEQALFAEGAAPKALLSGGIEEGPRCSSSMS